MCIYRIIDVNPWFDKGIKEIHWDISEDEKQKLTSLTFTLPYFKKKPQKEMYKLQFYGLLMLRFIVSWRGKDVENFQKYPSKKQFISWFDWFALSISFNTVFFSPD